MKLSVFVIRDRAVDAYMMPMFLQSTGQAIRMFGDQINKAEEANNLYHHPEDFDLFLLGTFDAQTGLFDVGVPSQVAIGKDLVIKK